MKILKVASIYFIASAFMSLHSSAYDLERMTTKAGKVYREVQIIDADKNGLLFRHAKGIAKESFPSLSTNIRDMFEPVEEIPASSPIDLTVDKSDIITDKGAQPTPQIYIPDLTLTMVIRQPVHQYPAWFCNLHPNPGNWPSHWPRFHYAHYLTNPVCRARATQNFLQATGLLPRHDGRMFHHAGRPNSIRFW